MTMTDCLNPTFLVTIGTIFLCLALLVVYFESKHREQNHKINSMLSLVSTLADELNNYKIGLNNLTMMVGGGRSIHVNKDYNGRDPSKLIHVSDDDEPLENDDDDDDEDSEHGENSDNVEDSDDEEDGEEDSDDEKEDSDDGEENSENDDKDNNNNDIDEIEIIDLENDLNNEIKTVDLEYLPSIEIVGVSKKIHLSLEGTTMVETIDFKKLSVAKLRELASAKNVSSEINKLKKGELIELLEQSC